MRDLAFQLGLHITEIVKVFFTIFFSALPTLTNIQGSIFAYIPDLDVNLYNTGRYFYYTPARADGEVEEGLSPILLEKARRWLLLRYNPLYIQFQTPNLEVHPELRIEVCPSALMLSYTFVR